MILRNVSGTSVYISFGNNESQDSTDVQTEVTVGTENQGSTLVEIPGDRIRFAFDQLEDLLTRGVLILVDESPYDEYVWRNTTGLPDYDGAFHLIPRSVLEFSEIQWNGVPQGMFPKINFQGGGVAVAPDTGGVVDITIETNTVLPYTRVTGDYTTDVDDLVLGCRITGPTTVTLATTTVQGQLVTVKDETGAFLTNTLTVVAQGGSLIDGAASYQMGTPYQSTSFVWTGDSWGIQ